jgi:hypothetical protein
MISSLLHPSDRRRHQSQREAMHLLTIHRLDCISSDADTVVQVRRLEGAAQHPGSRVDPCEDQRHLQLALQ